MTQLNLEIVTENNAGEVRLAQVSRGKIVNIAMLAQIAVTKIRKIETELNERFVERGEVIRDTLLAIISRQHIIYLGPPGTAKSELARAITAHIEGANFFQWLLNKTSDPADLLGPYSIKGMEKDKFLRMSQGRLPDAHIFFADEVYKSNNPTLNILLPILNERIFFNDGKANPIPLITMIAASNEGPEDESLAALHDRILFRHVVDYIKDPKNVIAIWKNDLAGRTSSTTKINPVHKTVITLEELEAVQQLVDRISVTEQTLKALYKLKGALEKASIPNSDRRWVLAVRILQANAVMNGRDKVNLDDLYILKYVLWSKQADMDIVEKEIHKLVNPHDSEMAALLKKAQEISSTTLAIPDKSARAGQAVEAKVKLEELIKKMGKVIKEAEENGRSTTELIKRKEEVEELHSNLLATCLGLKPSNKKIVNDPLADNPL